MLSEESTLQKGFQGQKNLPGGCHPIARKCSSGQEGFIPPQGPHQWGHLLHLNEANKRFNRVEEYTRITQRIHSYGIAVQAGIAFGFDSDTPGIFAETLDFLEDVGGQNATFNILTPFPGTQLFKRLEAEGRILTYDWDKYNSREDVVYQPKEMSREELLEGYRYVNQRFYSLPSIARRLARSPVGLWWTLPLNLAYAFTLLKSQITSFVP